jgi:hypothetical protein
MSLGVVSFIYDVSINSSRFDGSCSFFGIDGCIREAAEVNENVGGADVIGCCGAVAASLGKELEVVRCGPLYLRISVPASCPIRRFPWGYGNSYCLLDV